MTRADDAAREGAAREGAARWGTPLHLYDLGQVRADAIAIRQAFPDPWIRLYSLKANGLPGLLADMPRLGFGANAVSGGELSLARRAGFVPAATALDGIGKTDADLREAARLARDGTPLLWVSLESADEARALAAAVGSGGRLRAGSRVTPATRVDVLVRVNPQVRPETHEGLAVGAAESKFGMLPEELGAVVEAGGGAHGPLRWRGIHIHVGSQLGAVDAWRSAFLVGLATLRLQRAELPDLDTLDAGSGFPVDADPAATPTPESFARAADSVLDELGADTRPVRLAIEPGRALVARAGWVIARVLHVRDREQRLVVIDAGMTELIRPAMYGAFHRIVALTSLGRPVQSDGEQTVARVDGPACESTDRIGQARLPPLERGDLVAIQQTGAYGSAMASTYNGRPRAPEVAWDGGALRLLRSRGRRAALP